VGSSEVFDRHRPLLFSKSLPDAGERHGCGGRSAGGLSALAVGVRNRGALAKSIPLIRCHPPLHRPVALREDAARKVRGSLAAGTATDRTGTRRPGNRRNPLDGLPGVAREPQPHRAGGLPPARGLRLRLPRDLAPRRKERGRVPPDSAPGSTIGGSPTAPLRTLPGTGGAEGNIRAVRLVVKPEKLRAVAPLPEEQGRS
jgi:hypothetical protein